MLRSSTSRCAQSLLSLALCPFDRPLISNLISTLQIKETLPEEVRTKMYAAPLRDLPVITPNDLKDFDGFICARSLPRPPPLSCY